MLAEGRAGAPAVPVVGEMERQTTHRAAVLAVVALALAACGGAPQAAPGTCDGVASGGACWVAQAGITVSADRAARAVERAREFWGVPAARLEGWRVDLVRERTVIDGQAYDGYCFSEERRIVVTPFGGDCFENSALLHELGHAWGFSHRDPRMASEWPAIRDGMEASGWEGCARDLDGRGDGEADR